jgi:hypothetical protein
MAIQKSASVGEDIYIDPADVRGPWTILFPLAGISNGDTFRVIATSLSATLVTFDGNTKDIQFPGETDSTTFSLDMKGGRYLWQYNAGLDTWTVISAFQPTQLFP